ncbi:PREDICTED: uncharacterized protein LOC106814271 [Priapulus caudatus]|uniref:Uncharacterized protein LOC106814271 n=1 Tax=Priapulus caudatus TaxID=37621 RepID=A0ABM1EPD2_PRICU|nr:PREDICTED: uncharacterized protein LOC106814271 [Priapulus caudatus]
MMEGQLVCELCSHYVCARTKQHAKSPAWKHAWPAVIWTCLTKQQYADPFTFMQFLADDLRTSWMHAVGQWLPAMRQALCIQPQFSDTTRKMRTFKEDLDSGELRRLMRAPDNACLPEVRCPMGCYLYMDDRVDSKGWIREPRHSLHARVFWFERSCLQYPEECEDSTPD